MFYNNQVKRIRDNFIDGAKLYSIVKDAYFTECKTNISGITLFTSECTDNIILFYEQQTGWDEGVFKAKDLSDISPQGRYNDSFLTSNNFTQYTLDYPYNYAEHVLEVENTDLIVAPRRLAKVLEIIDGFNLGGNVSVAPLKRHKGFAVLSTEIALAVYCYGA